MIVAIDGPAASGKGTLARRLAQHFRLAHLDTGKLYRAAALHAITSGGDPADPAVAKAAAERVSAADLDNPRLREETVAQVSSVVAAIPAVRQALLAFQRDFARRPPGATGAVLDGRDIGTVVCPDADGQALRHRQPRGPRPPPLQGVAGKRRQGYIRARPAGHEGS